jgi:hydrogenase-4 membrane subunit HyfE
MNPSAVQTASNIITLLASLMLVLQLLMAVQSMIVTNIRLFALQSLLLAGIAAVVGYA